MRVGDRDGLIGRYSIEILSSLSLSGQRSMGLTELTLILGSLALKYLRDSEELLLRRVQRAEVCIAKAFVFELGAKW